MRYPGVTQRIHDITHRITRDKGMGNRFLCQPAFQISDTIAGEISIYQVYTKKSINYTQHLLTLSKLIFAKTSLAIALSK